MFKKIILLSFAAIVLLSTSNVCATAKSTSSKGQAIVKENKQLVDTLSLIDKYQAKYFEIYKKRNQAAFDNDYDYDFNNDNKELKKLESKVEKQITNKEYLKKYKKQRKQVGKCRSITTPEINECAEKDYNAISNLLDEVYKKVELKISSEDFKNLTLSQNKWQKEVKDYEKAYDSLTQGTLGTIIHYDYQIDMMEFRTLLLMLYL